MQCSNAYGICLSARVRLVLVLMLTLTLVLMLVNEYGFVGHKCHCFGAAVMSFVRGARKVYAAAQVRFQ